MRNLTPGKYMMSDPETGLPPVVVEIVPERLYPGRYNVVTPIGWTHPLETIPDSVVFTSLATPTRRRESVPLTVIVYGLIPDRFIVDTANDEHRNRPMVRAMLECPQCHYLVTGFPAMKLCIEYRKADLDTVLEQLRQEGRLCVDPAGNPLTQEIVQ